MLRIPVFLVSWDMHTSLPQQIFSSLRIDPLPGDWLTGDLTNHNGESAILSDKQTGQESRLMLVDLNLINSVYGHLSVVETRYHLMFIHIYFRLWLVRRKTWYLLFEFLKIWQHLKAEACFIPEVTCSVLSKINLAWKLATLKQMKCLCTFKKWRFEPVLEILTCFQPLKSYTLT